MNSFLNQAFPHLQAEGYQETSPATTKCNCIAWAAGLQEQWWSELRVAKHLHASPVQCSADSAEPPITGRPEP
jgi:hypothetical protein